MNRSRIGVDVGGTFTDVILQFADGTASVRKVLSTPPDYNRAVVGLAADPDTVDGVVHGTTVATNAVLERRGAVTALVTTAGFRDVLELRRLRIPHMYALRVGGLGPSSAVDRLTVAGEAGRRGGTRAARFHGEPEDVPVRSRESIGEQPEAGPLLVDEYDTTVVIRRGWTVRRDPATATLVLERDG